jgi:hypothetical protein
VGKKLVEVAAGLVGAAKAMFAGKALHVVRECMISRPSNHARLASSVALCKGLISPDKHKSDLNTQKSECSQAWQQESLG